MNTSVVTNCSTVGEKIPIETSNPSKVKSKNPIVANAIFISFVLRKEITEMILNKVDKLRNENRKKSSISFIGRPFRLCNLYGCLSYFTSGFFRLSRKKGGKEAG